MQKSESVPAQAAFEEQAMPHPVGERMQNGFASHVAQVSPVSHMAFEEHPSDAQ